jgi:hypothetical protein
MSLLLVILAVGCNQKNTETATKTEFTLENAKLEIEAANKNFMALVAARDKIGLANAYARTQNSLLLVRHR